MEFNFTQNIQYCKDIVDSLSGLLLYSHLPSAIASFLIGIFVLFKSKFSLLGKILFSISLSFSLWVISSLLIWFFYYKNSVVMALWSPIEIFSVLLFVLCLYFAYVFIEKKDISTWIKLLISLPLLAIVFVVPSNLNLIGYDIQECIAIENPIYTNYYIGLKIFFSIWIICFGIYKYFKAEKEFRKQILLLMLGMVIFLLSFLVAGYVAETTYIFIYEAIGLFGMVVFVGLLGYLIVKYKTFNIKLLGAQALVMGLILLIGSQFFFIRNATNRVLTAITLTLVISFGWLLIKAVKREIKQREEINRYANDLAQVNKELTKAKEKIDKAYQVEKQARAELERINEAKSQFLMATQHHLRTPLTAIKGFLSMAMEGDYGKLSEDLKEKLNFCFISANRLIKLVNEFLDISKLQLGKDILELKEVSLVDLLREAVDEVKPEADKKGIYLNLENHWGDEPLKITADPAKLKEALYNLIDNAVKYTEKGGVKVSLRNPTESVPPKIQIVVADTGIGMTAEEAKNIFERQFERGKEAKKVYSLGRGIGLFLAASIIREHKGAIRVESAGHGKGSTFYVDLPGK